MERVRYLREWRKQHEQLAVMTGLTTGLGVGLGGEVGVRGGGMDMEEVMRLLSGLMFSMSVLVSPFLFSLSFYRLTWISNAEGT